MGRNLALNATDHGFRVSGWDAWDEARARFSAEGDGALRACDDLQAFVASLRRPRRVVLLVKAGAVVDQTLGRLCPLLERGDLVVDSGNEHFANTERRSADLAGRGLRFFGMGISGGEEGARHGPSLMPGGDRDAYAELAPVLEQIAAKVADGPCVTYVGAGGAGHYVKMVHNGIEYGDMQLIAESYDVLRSLGGFGNAEIADAFEEWNGAELESFLVEISVAILRKKDEETGADLVDLVTDEASMKGTGKWTVQDAQEVGVPVPTIAAAVDARVVSGSKPSRERASRSLPGPVGTVVAKSERATVLQAVRHALYASKCASYAQGLRLIQQASAQRSWGVELAELARIWKGGCIIRAALLGEIQAAFRDAPELENLLLAPAFADALAARQEGWRRVVALAVSGGVPVPATAASLAHYDSQRRPWLPANLIQAQRDSFGAHGYRRLDRDGSFHSEWRS